MLDDTLVAYVKDIRSVRANKKDIDERRVNKIMLEYYKSSGGFLLLNRWASDDGVHAGILTNIEQLIKDYTINVLIGVYCSPEKKFGFDHFNTILRELCDGSVQDKAVSRTATILTFYGLLEKMRENSMNNLTVTPTTESSQLSGLSQSSIKDSAGKIDNQSINGIIEIGNDLRDS